MSRAHAQSIPAASTVYMFSGEVDTRRSAAMEEIISEYIDPEFSSVDVETFDGGEAKSIDILSAASTLPFSSPRRVVIVERVERMSKDEQDRIADYIPKLGERSCLILLTGEEARGRRNAPDNGSDDASTTKISPKLTAAVKKTGTYTSFTKLKSDALTRMASDMLRARGKRIEANALQTLVRAVALNPAGLEKEVDKLESYAADRDTIVLADVENLVPISSEDRVFPLIDAVAAGQAEVAVTLLQQTLAASAKPDREVLKIISLLARHFRLLYQTKYLETVGFGKRTDGITEYERSLLMSEKNPLAVTDWQKTKLIQQARAFTEQEIQKSLRMILECELAVKGLGTEAGSPRLNLEILVVKLSRRKKPHINSRQRRQNWISA